MIYDNSSAGGTRLHSILLENREKLTVCGVEDADSFDESRIILQTMMGSLIIKGENLHIDKLSLETGEVSIEGLIKEMTYEETTAAGSLWQRLFK